MSMTAKNKIRDVSIYYFAKYGYEGTSLSQIANEIGVKTPSLYAHFKSKEDIFFHCLDYALENDMNFFRRILEENKDMHVEKTLYKLLVEYEKRLENEVVSLFCLRTLYSPPHIFKPQLFDLTNERILQLGKLINPYFEKSKQRGNLSGVNTDEATEAYLCIFDGLIIEFMYAGSERFHYRLNATWKVFKTGVLT